ncbi:MAG TPA: hypothetical protein VJY62_04440, partial [Bacteroidia bacterium]|nr:hypothetical protein [Bacteroidia bacterium]
MKKAIILFLLLNNMPHSFAQITFQKTYGGTDREFAGSGQQTNDSGFIMTGSTYSFRTLQNDVYLVKTNPQGDTMWTRAFHATLYETGWSVQQTADSGFIISAGTQSTSSPGSQHIYLIKTDANGNLSWSKTIADISIDQSLNIKQTFDGGYILAGYTLNYPYPFYNAYLVKINAVGGIVWTKTYGGWGASQQKAVSVQQTADSGYVLCGNTNWNAVGDNDIFIIKTNSTGDTLWTKNYGGTGLDIAFSIENTTDNGYIVCGYTQSFGAGGNDMYVVKT